MWKEEPPSARLHLGHQSLKQLSLLLAGTTAQLSRVTNQTVLWCQPVRQ